jgi:hypothetical protein
LSTVEFPSLQDSRNAGPEKLQKRNPAGPATGSCKPPISTTPKLNEERLHWREILPTQNQIYLLEKLRLQSFPRMESRERERQIYKRETGRKNKENWREILPTQHQIYLLEKLRLQSFPRMESRERDRSTQRKQKEE